MYPLISSIVKRESRLAIGIMSGTSLDGIDAALVEIKGVGLQTKVQLIEFVSIPYEPEVREQIIELCDPQTSTVDKICKINMTLGNQFGAAAVAVMKKAQKTPEEISFISSHGQTIFHWPEEQATLQLGELANIASTSGVLTVGDFRPSDMAYQGQGAPLVPFVDALLFSNPTRNRVLLNIGGISNATIVPASKTNGKQLEAFDIGPGNVLIDGVIRTLTNKQKSFDANGSIAKSGTVDQEWLNELVKNDAFLSMQPPKSTGREHYNNCLLDQILTHSKQAQLSNPDLVATITQYTVEAIVRSLQAFVFPKYLIDELIVSGGGVHNDALMEGLQKGLSCSVLKLDDLAFSGDAKEAIAFAILGNQFLHGLPNNMPTATGASRDVIMGKLVLPSHLSGRALAPKE